MVSKGDKLMVHGRDTLGDVTIALNKAGEQVFTCVVNPTQLGGERLRREASLWDSYNFTSVRPTFVSALGNNVGGNFLGWFDMDPSDTVSANPAGLKVASAHPGAGYTKDYNEHTWTMPRPLAGRYYMEGSTKTASDKRLTQEAVFTLAVNNPIPSGTYMSTPTFPAVVGTMWVSYTCVLSKATIQERFVGACDIYTGRDTSGLNINNSAVFPTTPATTNNAGTSSAVVAGTVGWNLPPGYWSFDFYYGNVAYQVASSALNAYFLPYLLVNGSSVAQAIPGVDTSYNSTLTRGANFHFANTVIAYSDWNVGYRFEIPDDGNSYFMSWNIVYASGGTPGNEIATDTVNGTTLTAVLTQTFPSPFDTSLSAERGSHTTQLLRRLRRLELKLDTGVNDIDSRDYVPYLRDASARSGAPPVFTTGRIVSRGALGSRYTDAGYDDTSGDGDWGVDLDDEKPSEPRPLRPARGAAAAAASPGHCSRPAGVAQPHGRGDTPRSVLGGSVPAPADRSQPQDGSVRTVGAQASGGRPAESRVVATPEPSPSSLISSLWK